MGSEFWIISFWIAVTIFISGIVAVWLYTYQGRNSWSDNKQRYTKRNVRTTVSLLFFIVFTVSFILFFPINWDYFNAENNQAIRAVKTVFLSVHHTIRLFIVDVEYDIVKDYLAQKQGFTQICYGIFAVLIYIMAPALTFSFVMTFFHRIMNGNRMATALRNDMYVFSELNEKSLIFAEDIRKNHPKAAIIFTNVYEEAEDEEGTERVERAKDMRAISLKNSITQIRFGYQLKKKKLYLILISANEETNMIQSMKLIERYKHYPKTALYMISYRDEAEAVFDGVGGNLKEEKNPDKKSSGKKGLNKHFAQSDEYLIELHRINPARDLIDNLLFNEGTDLFKNARDGKIGVIILGLGEYGNRLLRALSWYLQMDGYEAEIDAFDVSQNAESKMKSQCPCLLCDKINGRKTEGEAFYNIRIHSGIDVFGEEFMEIVRRLYRTTYVFISIGEGKNNIKAAMNLRTEFERMGIHPVIQVVSYSDEMNEIWQNHLVYKDKAYDIKFLGTLENQFKEEVIFRSELQKRAFALHMSYYEDIKNSSDKPVYLRPYAHLFWFREYNYHSSISSVIHMEAKKYCKIPGFVPVSKDGREVKLNELTSELLSDQEIISLQILEHKRWNSYVRSDGYIYGREKNALGKTHPDLVPFSMLEKKEMEKDIRTEYHIRKSWEKYGYLYDAIDADKSLR